MPVLAELSVRDTALAMQDWRSKADDHLDREPPTEPERSARLSPLPDGRGRVVANLDREGYQLAQPALRAAEAANLDHPAAQRRADALAGTLRHFLDHQTDRPGRRHRPHLNVVITLEDLQRGGGGRYIDGTPIDRHGIATLLCDSVLHRVLLQGRSAILDYGMATRTIPANLFNALVLRDGGCRFEGCDRPASWCDGHHVTHFEQGGPTRIDNLVLVCNRHHHLIHRQGWRATLAPDATFTVTDPNGRTHTTRPPGPLGQPGLPDLAA